MFVLAGRASADTEDRPHGVYVDAFGKGGLWGLGYDWRSSERIALGLVGSYYLVGGDKYTTLSPYLAIYPLVGVRHAWLVHLGPQLIRRTVSSPGPEWSGMTTTAFDAEISSGWEYRNHVLLRVYGMAAIADRVVPGLGVSLGWTL